MELSTCHSLQPSSPHFLQSLINTIPDPVFVKDRQHHWMLVNDAFCQFAGCAAAELLGKSDYDFFPAEQAAVFWEKDELVFATGATNENEETLTDAQGKTSIIATKKSLLQDDHGNLFLVCIIRDVTRYKQTETKLRASEAHFRNMADHLPSMVWIAGTDANITYFNQTWLNFTGRPLTQDSGNGWTELLHPDDLHPALEVYMSAFNAQAPLEMECRFRRADGEYRWTLTKGVPYFEPDGSFSGYVGTCLDISDRKQAETQLRESQQLLQLVIDNLPQIIVWKDRHSVYLGANAKTAEVAGLSSPEAMIGKTDYDLPCTIEEAQAYRACDRRVMESGIAELHIIETQQQADGSQIWLDTNKIPLRDAEDNVIGILCTAEDITLRQQAEAKLQQLNEELESRVSKRTAQLKQFVDQLKQEAAERKIAEQALIEHETCFRSIVENANDTICMLTPQGELAYMSPNWCDLLGYSLQETLTHHFSRFVHPDDQPNCLDIFQRIVTSTDSALVAEYRAMHRDGSQHWHTTNFSTISDTEGQVQHCVAIIRDITDRKQAEEALRQQEQFLRSIYDGVEHPIFVVEVLDGQQFHYTDWNLFAERTMGISAEAIRGKTPEDLFGAVEGQLVRRRLQQCLETRQPVTYEEWLAYTGELSWWLTTLNPLWNDAGQVYQIVGTTFNITERKMAEAQLQQQTRDLELALQELQSTQMQMIQGEKMSSLGQLVAGVAHEINNPVNFIYGNLSYANGYTKDLLQLLQLYQMHYPQPAAAVQEAAEAIELEFLVEDLPKLLNSMRIGAERIQKIVASLRTFSRMDEAEMKAVDIQEGIESTLMILQSRLKAKDHRPEIAVVREYGSLPLVECHAGQLNQVFMNILSNAIDALEEQFERVPFKPRITIRTTVSAANQITIQLADNGAGMSATVKQRLFDPFFTTKPVGKGTGMGMSISYQIITERHNGSIECTSAPSQGTEFSISIPIQPTHVLSKG